MKPCTKCGDPLPDGWVRPVCQGCKNERQREIDTEAREARAMQPPDDIGVVFNAWRLGATGQLQTPMGVYCQNERLAA